MGKSITIKLVPKDKDKIYKPQPDYADLYVLMNRLHFHSINEAITEEKEKIGELELQLNQTKRTINKTYEEESSLNVMSNCLEAIDRTIKKQALNGSIPDLDHKQIEEFNNILKESSLELTKKLKFLKSNVFKDNNKLFLEELDENLKLIKERKTTLKKNVENLNSYISKIDTLKENINSSSIDIDSVEVALQNIKIK
ncbi:MAG: hypothetical protein AB1782_13965 [Cyanobacteriota bacterium]